MHTFSATLEDDPTSGEVFVALPVAVAEAMSAKHRLPVQTTIDGFPHQGNLVDIGDGQFGLPVPREIRRALHKNLGDAFAITLVLDEAERLVEQPDDLAAAFVESPLALAKFKAMTLVQQRDYVRWLTGAKKPEIRSKRLNETIYRLERGLKRP